MLEYRIRINQIDSNLQEAKLQRRDNYDGIWELTSTDWETIYTGKECDECIEFLKNHLMANKRSEIVINAIISYLDIK